jgi:type II secretory pathway pseudopilin PulG
MQNKKKNIYGFTILEIIIGIVLLGLVISITLPTLSTLQAVELKTTANQMQGLIKEVYSRTALTGKIHRIAFDIDKSLYWVEEIKDSPIKKQPEKELVDEESEEEDSFAPIAGDLGEKARLKKRVRFFSISTEPTDEKIKEGQTQIYFYPAGYVQKARISLTDDDIGTRIFTITTNPLTGESVIAELGQSDAF